MVIFQRFYDFLRDFTFSKRFDVDFLLDFMFFEEILC